ncbi:MAG: Gfo/Idh/MocA family oxidoreductase [Bryobacteraceae bacterium]|nr:Gfo/Idh/MocA family oxidoreductase [Bryobacteraceae bacterium]
MTLKIGIAGYGYIGQVHHKNLQQDPRVEITAIYDADPARRGDTPAASYEELLDRCDAVYVAAPNTRHASMAMQAIAAGKHVFCEKPMAVSVEDALKLHEAASAARTVFQVGHNRRFAPVYKKLRELLLQAPAHTAHIKMNRGELLSPAWTGDESVTGGYLFETPIHMFDMMRFQFGEIASLDARLSGKNEFSMLVEFTSGMHATFVTAAYASWFFPYERVEVFGEYTTLETSEMDAIQWRIGLESDTKALAYRELEPPRRFGLAEGDRLFVDAVLAGAAPPVTSFDGLRSVELVDACYRSAASNQRIRV